MRNRTEYQKIEQMVLQEDWLIERAKLLTKSKICKIAGVIEKDMTDAFFRNLRQSVIAKLQLRDKERNRDFIKSILLNHSAFINKFPKASIEIDENDGIRISLKGESLEVING